MSAGSPPTLWCDLIFAATPSSAPPDSITSEYSVPCTRKRTSPSFAASSSKTRMNSSPTIVRFSSGSETPGEPREEALLRLHVHERHAEVARERLDDLLRLVLAQEPVVDEDARQLVADGLVHEERRDRGVDAARERAEHALAPDSRADPLDLLLDDGGGRPGRRDVRDLVEEVLQDVLPEAACARPRGGTARRTAAARDPRTRRSASRATTRSRPRPPAARSPSRGGSSRPSARAEGRGRARTRSSRSSVFPNSETSGAVDGAAEIARHELHPVADAERRDAEHKDRRVDLGRAVRVHRCRPAGEDERGGIRAARSRRADSRWPTSSE